MTSIDFSEYSELVGEGGYEAKAQTKPEDEFFHAMYISGQQRENHIGEIEMPGKLQIRGLKSNMDEVNIIIVHVKNVLVKSVRTPDNKEKMECFSYQLGQPPWKGTSGNMCGKNSTERSATPFCSICRSQLIITGVYLDEKTGAPFKVNDKPVFVFIRAKGVKYGNVADYLSGLAKRDDLEPVVTPVTEESKKFEKSQVNNKRFVTKITVAKQSTNYGLKDVFKMETGIPLSIETVKSVLNKSKETMDKFKEKFDWSKTGSSNYSTKPVEEGQKFDFSEKPAENKTPVKEPAKVVDFSFEDVEF